MEFITARSVVKLYYKIEYCKSVNNLLLFTRLCLWSISDVFRSVFSSRTVSSNRACPRPLPTEDVLSVLLGVLLDVLLDVLFSVLFGVLLGVLFGVFLGFLLGVILGILLGVSLGVFLGILLGVLFSVLFGVLLGVLVIVFGRPTLLAGGVSDCACGDFADVVTGIDDGVCGDTVVMGTGEVDVIATGSEVAADEADLGILNVFLADPTVLDETGCDRFELVISVLGFRFVILLMLLDPDTA